MRAAVLLAVGGVGAAGLAEHFWMNAGGGGLDRFGPDLVGSVVGGPTATWEAAAGVDVPLAWGAYRSFRYGVGGAAFGYDLPVDEPGVYDCGVHLVEWQAGAAGERVVGVAAGGVSEGGVDVFARAGKASGLVVFLAGVDAAGGVIELRLTASKGDPMLSAVTCSRVGAAPGKLPDASASPVPDVTVAPGRTFATRAVPEASAEGGAVAALVDEEKLELEDDEFRQEFEVEMDVGDGEEAGSGVVAEMKDVLSAASGTNAEDWRVADADVAEERVLRRRTLVRQGEAGVLRYGMKLAARLRRGKEGEESFDGVVDEVESGGALSSLVAGGFPAVKAFRFASAPKLSVAAKARDGAEKDDDDGGGGSKAGAIAGGILGALALLALIAFIAFVALRRGGGRSSRDFDAPPPAEASVLDEMDVGRASDVDIAGGGDVVAASHGEYIDDPDSRLTAATDEHVEDEMVVDSQEATGSGGIGINKDVWGRGTGSDF